MADTKDLKSFAEKHEGSTPSPRTINKCACGHSVLSHPFGLSESLIFNGSCMLCSCKFFNEAKDE